MLADSNIAVIYSGPIWAGGIDDMAELLQKRLDCEDMPLNASQSVFSIFVEQMNNMLMYSAEKEHFSIENKHLETSKGVFILGKQGKTFFVQSGNVMKNSSVEMLKGRIDYLNTLDKKELRQYYKEQMKAENDNLESQGAGLGLIEIARRATSKIDYEFTPHGNGLSYFTMYVII
jgi:hypothetical protein